MGPKFQTRPHGGLFYWLTWITLRIICASFSRPKFNNTYQVSLALVVRKDWLSPSPPQFDRKEGSMARPIVRRESRSSAHRLAAVGIALVLLLGPLSEEPRSFAAPRPLPASRAYPAMPAAILRNGGSPGKPDPPADDNLGEITVAQPKIYQYERVNTLLDGLLRDVEGISLADLTALDPNAANGAAVKFVQSMLEIGAQYNQGAAVTNALALRNYQATQSITSQQITANSAYLQQLYQQRQTVMTQLLAEQQQQVQLQTSAATATGAAATSLTAQATAAGTAVTELQQELASINSQIAAASTLPTVTPPTLTPTTGGTAQESASTFSDFLKNLPSGIQSDVNSQLQSPTLPATKRMDNFITLLYERLAREVSALQDDVMRDPQNAAFLVQFDVGLYPSSEAKNRVGVVGFKLNCGRCKVYSIYPGQSSYNLANYEGASRRNSFFLSLATLFGFGINADYRRQEDTLHGDLVQSVYMAGFQQTAGGQDRFGWYYGPAPFEQLVTPGMRSTFAIITVPREEIQQATTEGCADSLCRDGNGNVQLPITVDAGWARHNDPSDRIPYDLPNPYTVTLPGADDLATSPVVLRERDHLHVLGMEYNPVYSPAPKPAAPGGAPATPPPPGTAQATASGTGTGSATVTVSGAGTASASSTGTGATAATATATNPTPTPSTSPGAPAPTDSLTGCAVGQCAAVLIKLAEPIDPNLVVTVRGEPLRRVRDWRGRATSILPPVQSESDFPPPAAAAGATAATPPTPSSRYESVSSRSLLEADQLSPDTWLEVDSHRLLLNISRNLAGGEDFPSIQIVAPGKRALFIPTDLDEGYTEIVTNGFHLPTRDGKQLGRYLCLHLRSGRNLDQCYLDAVAYPSSHKDTKFADAWNELYPSGPYPYETFLPLFLPQPGDQPIYAYLGETGIQLLISFADDPLNQASPVSNGHRWLASHTQVMLEDEELDLAWSLDCYPQGSQLVCDLPRDEIRDAYTIVQEICESGPCLSTSGRLGDFPSISTLQVWVEQSDPDLADYFRSTVPARLGRFPVQASKEDPKAADKFRPWHFESVTADAVTATECAYPGVGTGTSVRLLGRQIPGGKETPALTNSTGEAGCFSMQVPTAALIHPELAIRYGSSNTNTAPESLLTLQFRPYFEKPVVIPHRDDRAPFSITKWEVRIPAERVDYNDSLDSPDVITKFKPQWTITGAMNPIAVRQPDAPLHTGGSTPGGWNDASKNEQIQLVLNINKVDLDALPEHQPIDVLRGPDRISRLPDLWSLLMPTQLTATYISTTQFALQGKNAGAIDAVSLQGPGAPSTTLTAASGADFALVTLPGPPSSTAKQPAASKPAVTSIASTTGKAGDPALIVGTGFGSKGTVKFDKTSAKVACWMDTNLIVTVPAALKDGAKVSVTVTTSGGASKSVDFTVGTASSTPVTLPTCKAAAPAGTGTTTNSKGEALSAGTYSIVPLVSLGDGKYLPLDVKNADGKALTLVVPAQPAPAGNGTDNNPPAPKGATTTTTTITKKTNSSTQAAPAGGSTPPASQAPAASPAPAATKP
jgi:IPT/TIG domain